MEPETYKQKLHDWLMNGTTLGKPRDSYIESVTKQLLEKQLKEMEDIMTSTTTSTKVEDLKDVEEILKEINEEITPPTFSDGEKLKFTSLKTSARVAMRTFFDCDPSSVIKNHMVIAGSAFVDWWYGTEPKDIDCFILDDHVAKTTIRHILREKGYKMKDVEYLKRMTKGARHVQEVWEHFIKEENGYAYQFIFTDCKTRKELLDDFDFKHCCVSYHMDQLHITRNICNAIRDKHLIMNNTKNIMPWRLQKFIDKGFVDPTEQTATNSVGVIYHTAMKNLDRYNKEQTKKSSMSAITGWLSA